MLRVICNLLLGLIVTCTVGLAAVLGIPLLMGDHIYAVQSGSMQPAYPAGSIVAVQPVAPSAVAVGDVITFTLEGLDTPVTHRVIEVDAESRTFLTKGDNNQNADFVPVFFSNLEGRVRFGIPYIGSLIALLHMPSGALVLAWVLFLVALLLTLPELARQRKSRAMAAARARHSRRRTIYKKSAGTVPPKEEANGPGAETG